MHFEFGDVVLVPFPFTSQTTSKNGPLSSSVTAPTMRQNPMLS
jgi:hypothetical protein